MSMNTFIDRIQNLPEAERAAAVAAILAGPTQPKPPKALSEPEQAMIADLRKEILALCANPTTNEALIAAHVSAIRRIEAVNFR
jgi:hypothetical protein